MARLRFLIRFNEGRKGVPLDRLERIAADVNKFLISISTDIDLPESTAWIGTNFRNKSLSWLNESQIEVDQAQAERFNQAVVLMAKGEKPNFVTDETVHQFYELAVPFERGDRIKVGVYPNANGKIGRAYWREIKPEKRPDLALERGRAEYIGSVQGILHSWYKESRQPYFYVRELSSFALVKCFYTDDIYDEVANAAQSKQNVMHVHGMITADKQRRSIQWLKVDRIFVAKPFTMKDVDEFFRSGKLQ